MDFREEFKCNQCLRIFQKENYPFKMISCVHNICKTCYEEISKSQTDIIECSYCGVIARGSEIKNFQINSSVVKKIEAQAPKLKNQLTIPFCQENKSHYNSKFLINDDSENLLSRDDYPTKSNKKSNQGMGLSLEEQICSVHKKNLEIICIDDSKGICAHCAIFGNHKKHILKTFEQFREDYESRMKDLLVLKRKKYVIDKKRGENLDWGKKLNEKKQGLMTQVQGYFKQLREKLKIQQSKTKEQIRNSMLVVENDINEMMKKSMKMSNEYANWQSDCENMLSRINQSKNLSQKIRMLYNPSFKREKGQKILIKMEKKFQEVQNNIESEINAIRSVCSFPNLQNLIKVYRQKNQKSFHVQKFLKGKSKVDSQYMDNSFIFDYTSRDFSIILENQENKTPPKNGAINILSQTMKIPSPRISSRLGRCKSNCNIKMRSPQQRKKGSKILDPLSVGNPQNSCGQFIKKDLKNVLDLQNCNLDDERVYECLKQVRRYRKIRGLKLNKNSISDKGFVKIIDLLGSTSNLNFSDNLLSEQILNVIMKNREKFSSLRIINISSNKLGDEKKAKIMVETLKKIGIIVTL